ncbi:MAG: hypothetical protein DMD61_10875 [Gemmatimonadetes bacterium]|nr:MAG: hypothetical protein DMD61_10875 [Gemmatimonadota bacterium]
MLSFPHALLELAPPFRGGGRWPYCARPGLGRRRGGGGARWGARSGHDVGSGDTVSESEVGRRYLLKAGLPEGAVVALPAGTSTAASLEGVAHWFSGKDSRRVLLVSDGFHMLRLQIIATHLGLAPFTSPAPNSPIRSNPRRNAAYYFAEGFKVPVTWIFNR